MAFTPALVTPRALTSLFGAEAPVSDVRNMKHGYVFELLDTAQASPLRTIVLVMAPTTYNLAEPHQSTLTPASDGSVVDESVGVIMADITIEGTCGEKHRPLPSGSSAAAVRTSQHGMSGTEHFMSLRDLFRQYSGLKADPTRSHRVKLTFHSLRDDDHFVLSEPRFESPRGKQSRTHYIYRITAKVIGRAESLPRTEAVPAEEIGFTSALRDISEAFHDARAAFVTVNKYLGEIQRKVANVQAVMTAAAGFMNVVGSAIREGGDLLIAYPFRTVLSLTNSVGDIADGLADAILAGTVGAVHDAERSLREMEGAFDRIAMFPQHFQAGSGTEISERYFGPRALTRRDMDEQTAGATPGSRTAANFGSVNQYGLSLGNYNSAESVRLSATHTLEQLALEYGSSFEAIVLANDLRPPYLSRSGGPGVAKPGDTLLVPTTRVGAGQTTGVASPEYDDPDAALFGVGFALDPVELSLGHLDIAVDEAHGAMDAAYATGVSNLINDITITFHTERGETAFLPEIGVTRDVGRKGTVESVILASTRLREGLLTDPRITGIQSSRVVLRGDQLIQEITPTARGRTAGVPLSLPFGTASGE